MEQASGVAQPPGLCFMSDGELGFVIGILVVVLAILDLSLKRI
jgi:hypothetical protein